MATFAEPSEYPQMNIGQLKAEASLLETVIHIEEFFYLDNLADLVNELGPEVVRVLPSAYMARAVIAAKAVAVARRRIELLEMEISLKLV